MIRQLDIDAIVAACEDGDDAALQDASNQLGVVLARPDLERIGALLGGSLGLADVINTIFDAVEQACGIATREVPDVSRGWTEGKHFCVAVRHAEQVVVGIARVENLPKRISHVWPELKPWYQNLPRNRPRLERWAAQPAADRVALPLLPTSEDKARLADGSVAVERALLAEVLANPDDDQPRLVLADHLLEHDDARGEFIRLQCLLDADTEQKLPNFNALRKRCSKLQAGCGERMAGEVPLHASAFAFERGFVSDVTMNAGAFRKHGERLFGAHPIHTLRILPLNDAAIDKLGRAPALRLVQNLVLRQHIGQERQLALASLGRSKHLQRLRSLEISNCLFDPEEITRALSTLRAPSLRSLAVNSCTALGHLVAGLANNSAPPSLSSLVLEGAYYAARPDDHAEAIAQLGTAAAFRELHTVRFDGYPDPKQSSFIRDWLAGPNAASLRQLWLSVADDDVIAALINSPAAPELRSLHVITAMADPIIELLGSPRLSSLEALLWSHTNSLPEPERVARAALALPSTHPLRALDVPGLYPGLKQKLRERFEEPYIAKYWAFYD